MPEKKLDRRVQRTRKLLNDALMALIQEKGYDSVTIEDITERANLGRTTFYLHYQSKDDLLLDHHDHFVGQLNLGSPGRGELLGTEPQAALVEFLGRLRDSRGIYQAFRHAKDADIIMRNVLDRGIQAMVNSLEATFPDVQPSPPAEILSRYIVEGHFALLDWWIAKRRSETPEQIAAMLQQMRAAIVRDAYGISAESNHH